MVEHSMAYTEIPDIALEGQVAKRPEELLRERLGEITSSIRKLESRFGLEADQRALIVNPARQELYVVMNDQVENIYPISTSKNGLGSAKGGGRTPIGTHKIAEKIGEGLPFGTVFTDRLPTGSVVTREQLQGRELAGGMTSRILWLSGLEPGVNQGGEVDSHDRYIYIHGTKEEHAIGAPASYGCIRMVNDDVITLFNIVKEGTLVEIEDKNIPS